MKKLAAGIDIGGTNTVFGLVDSSGNILYKDAIPTTINIISIFFIFIYFYFYG